ncbi:DUF2304 domain-containing protein [Actinomyces provencensis]|uniref:DUF2304 domain-containing protein n=1 Tax=Actinomyces provencensis TaxID=1720198 RepID=UPI00096A9F21|nr:DUF2304 domain-containing protein [Actinomyces provencensis]
MNAYSLGLVFSLLVLVVIFLRLRNSRMQERYATWWLVIAFFLILISAFPGVLKWLSDLIGIVVPLNLAFFLAGVVILLMSLQFSVDLSHAAENRRRLAEEVAILRADVEELQGRLRAEDPDDNAGTGD